MTRGVGQKCPLVCQFACNTIILQWSYYIQPNLFGDLLTQVGEQEHYQNLFLVPPCMGPSECAFSGFAVSF